MSQRVRILAVAAFVALLALCGGFLLLSGGQGSTGATVKQIKPLHPVKRHVRSTAKVTPKKAAVVHKKQKARPVHAKKRKVVTPAVIDGMPGTLALALQRYEVVVVSLYAPRSSVDAIAMAEARQGAGQAGAASWR